MYIHNIHSIHQYYLVRKLGADGTRERRRFIARSSSAWLNSVVVVTLQQSPSNIGGDDLASTTEMVIYKSSQSTFLPSWPCHPSCSRLCIINCERFSKTQQDSSGILFILFVYL